MSHLLELLGCGLEHDLGDLLDRYFWSPDDPPVEGERAAGPDDCPDTHRRLGVACLRAGQIDRALDSLTRACRLQPAYPPTRLALAVAHAERGEAPAALEHIRAALRLLPDEAPVLLAAGLCCEKLDRPGDAVRHYRAAAAQEGPPTAVRQRLAAAALVAGDVQEAIEQYRALCQEQPDRGATRSILAHLYHHASAHERSAEEYAAAISIEPENWALADDEVEALVAEGQLHQAVDRLHAMLEQQGAFADLHVRLADLHSRMGNDDLATTHYRTALEISPTYLEATVKFGTHHLVCGRWEMAAEAFLQAADLNDRVLLNYVGMGVAQAAAGRADEAAATFELAAAVEPNSTLLLTEMAALHLKARSVEAVTAGKRVRQALGVVKLDHEGLVDRQLRLHARQVARRPEHADLRYRYGVLLRARQQVAEAAEQFSQAVRICPAYVRAWVRLGVAQKRLGDGAAAAESFRRAMDMPEEALASHYRLALLHTDRQRFQQMVRDAEAAAGEGAAEQVRASLALSLENLGLIDPVASTWRSLDRLVG